jgi:drug/metabolite transporter (DMT)-like permease
MWRRKHSRGPEEEATDCRRRGGLARHVPFEQHAAAVRAYLYLSLAALFWSGNFVVGRAVHGQVPPIALAFWRWTAALAILLVLARRPLAAQWRTIARAWPIVVPLGILGVGNFNTLVYLGLTETSATNGLLLQSACPAFIVAIAAGVGWARPALAQLAGIALSLAGVAVILAKGALGALSTLAFSPGDLWILLAVLSWSIYTLLLARRPKEVDPLALLTALVVVGVLWIAPWYALEAARGARIRPDGTTLAAVAYTAAFASVAAYALWNAGVARVGASRAGVFLHLMPAFGSLLAIGALGEQFRPFHAAGIALILAGVWLAGVAPGQAAGASSPRSSS